MARAPKFTNTVQLATAVRELLANPLVPALLAAYFAEERDTPFAGRMFDHHGENDPKTFSNDDLVAVSLLDVRFGPPAVRAIVHNEEFNDDLALLNTEYPSQTITDMAVDDNGGVYESAGALYARLCKVPGVGPTRASKLLARKRPALIPIGDSVIRRAFGIDERENWWRSLAEVLAHDDVSDNLNVLNQLVPEVKALRILDVTAWMLHSRSRAAIDARAQAASSVN